MIETRLLHYFLTVAREQNITNAAKTLNITQPTLSRQMTCLEHQIGAKLFQRDSRPLVLTDEGVLLRRRAEEILELLEKTEAEVTIREEQVEGTVYIGCGELGAVRVLSDLMTGFRQRHPRVVFDVYTTGTDRIKRRMDEGLTDIGLLLEPADMERFEYIRMPHKERWVTVMPAGAPLAKQKAVTARELADVPIIVPSRQKVFDEVANWFGEYYNKLDIVAANNLVSNCVLLAQSGIGYALAVEGGLPFLDSSELCALPLSPELTTTSVLAWKRNKPLSSAALQFKEYAKRALDMDRS